MEPKVWTSWRSSQRNKWQEINTLVGTFEVLRAALLKQQRQHRREALTLHEMSVEA